jgi:hypothetical protein
VQGHIGAPQLFVALGLSIVVFKPEWQAVSGFRSVAIYAAAIAVLLIGWLGVIGILQG